MIGEFLTVAELAESLGVTPQRCHAILRTYEVPVIKPHARLTLVPKTEARKLLRRDRPTGRHVEKK